MTANQVDSQQIKPFTCLVVDDSEFARLHLIDLMTGMLTDPAQVTFETACGGDEAIATYQRFKPDLVMMDIVMPGIDGVETVRQICQIDPHARIVMVSSLSYQEKVKEAIRAGAKHFVVKPIKSELLYRIVAEVLSS